MDYYHFTFCRRFFLILISCSKRWKRRTTRDDIKASEIFLKREKQHSEQLHAKRFGFVFRERSIDDGSHFDPRLDKYPSGTLKSNRTEKLTNKTGTLKSEKKIGGLEKVRFKIICMFKCKMN